MENNQATVSGYDSLINWLFIYTFIYAFFHILPPFLNYEIKNLLMIGDVFDFLTPFVLVFMVYRIYLMLLPHTRDNSNFLVKSVAVIILIFGAVSFVEGHGNFKYFSAASNFNTKNFSFTFTFPANEIYYIVIDNTGKLVGGASPQNDAKVTYTLYGIDSPGPDKDKSLDLPP